MADSVRHHICFIVPVDAALKVMNVEVCRALLQFPQETYSSQEQARTILRADTLRQGEFNMVADWEGVGKKAIRLHRQCALVGSVYIIVGEYAGV